MKLYHVIFSTLVLLAAVSLSSTNEAKKNCPKLTETPCKATKDCRWVTGQNCNGKFLKFCVADAGKCKAKQICTKSKSDNKYYKYQYNCLPEGFSETKSKHCNCTKPPAAPPGQPAAPPGEVFCAQLPYETCIANKDQCDSRYGTACGNLQYTFCRGLRQCNETNRCAQEPSSGLNYLFTEFCIPNQWRPQPLNTCKCLGTTTNQCPQCPPSYSCDPDGPLTPDNCFPISTVPILPPSEPPASFV